MHFNHIVISHLLIYIKIKIKINIFTLKFWLTISITPYNDSKCILTIITLWMILLDSNKRCISVFKLFFKYLKKIFVDFTIY